MSLQDVQRRVAAAVAQAGQALTTAVKEAVPQSGSRASVSPRVAPQPAAAASAPREWRIILKQPHSAPISTSERAANAQMLAMLERAKADAEMDDARVAADHAAALERLRQLPDAAAAQH